MRKGTIYPPLPADRNPRFNDDEHQKLRQHSVMVTIHCDWPFSTPHLLFLQTGAHPEDNFTQGCGRGLLGCLLWGVCHLTYLEESQLSSPPAPNNPIYSETSDLKRVPRKWLITTLPGGQHLEQRSQNDARPPDDNEPHQPPLRDWINHMVKRPSQASWSIPPHESTPLKPFGY